MTKKAITYKDSGVDIDKADSFIRSLTPMVRATRIPGVMGRIGGFSGFFSADFKGIQEPVLAASTDGVGTKLMMAEIAGKYNTIGIDLVAMCVNDIVACGARPLFFLDYFATGRLNTTKMLEVMRGIAYGCKESGCAIIGGETAELPGLYKNEDYDLAGFCVGVVDKKKIIDGSQISPGDVMLGIASSGPHSNGYSLIRKLFSAGEIKNKFKKDLLRPTALYAKPIVALLRRMKIKGIAHITGGGFYDNIIRILPKGCAAVLNRHSWVTPEIFNTIQERSRTSDEEMYRTFNMGIGMVLILSRKNALKTQAALEGFGFRSYIIGEVTKGKRQVVI